MNIYYLCPFWGSEDLSAVEFIDKVINSGFDGIEINIPDDLDFEIELMSEIKKHNLVFVAQQWLEPKKESVESYMIRLKNRLYHLAKLKPNFINSHTGRDFYSFDENCKIIDMCNSISAETGVLIKHETHRGRFNYSLQSTVNYLEEYPNLSLTGDLSHWVTVSESFLEDQYDNLKHTFNNISYIHARVGHTQSPQVNSPFTPENSIYLDIFTSWWQKIISLCNQDIYICPEFGPYPYISRILGSTIPVIEQWSTNVEMMNYLKKIIKFVK